MVRHLYVCRHGERIDHVFDVDWTAKYFLKDGQVNRHNINLPRSLPERENLQDYARDSPLTNIGLHQATLTGEALKDAGVTFSHVFSSPAYRCVQTGTNILKAMGLKDKLSINIEPGLFEWLGPTYRGGRPKWFSPQQLQNLGFNINTEYKSIMEAEKLVKIPEETLEEWYNRAYRISGTILDSLKEYTNVLFLAHGGSLDPCTRQLSGRPPRTDGDLAEEVPYCGIITLAIENDGSKRVEAPPIPTLLHHGTIPFDRNVFNTENSSTASKPL